MKINGKTWPKIAVVTVALILFSGVLTQTPADNKISDMMLDKARTKLIAQLDQRGYKKTAEYLKDLDAAKWGAYAGRISAGEFKEVAAEILAEKAGDLKSDLWEKGKDRAEKAGILSKRSRKCLEFLEKHHQDLSTIQGQILAGNYRQAGTFIVERAKQEFASELRSRAAEFSMDVIKKAMNELFSGTIKDAGGIYFKIVELWLYEIEAFGKWVVEYNSQFRITKPDGTQGWRTFCEQYIINRDLGWDPKYSYENHNTAQYSGSPASLQTMVTGGFRNKSWIGTTDENSYWSWVQGEARRVSRPSEEIIIKTLEACYIRAKAGRSELQRAQETGRLDATRILIDPIQKGMEKGREEFIETLRETKITIEFDLIVNVLNSKSKDKISGATVSLDGNKKDAPTGTAVFKLDHRILDPSGWISGSGKTGFELVAEATDYQAKTMNLNKDDLQSRFNQANNQIVVNIELDPDEPTEFEVVVTVRDSKSGDKIKDAKVTFDGSTQTAPTGTVTFTKPYKMLAPDNSATQVDLSAEADKYPAKTKQLTAGELAQKLDKDKNRVNLEISLDPKEEPQEFDLVVTVVDATTGAQVANATVTADGDKRDAPTGVVKFKKARDLLEPSNSQTQLQVSAEAKGYESKSTSHTWGSLANRLDKDANEINIQISLSQKGAGKISRFEVVCDRSEIFEDEVSICAAKLYYESGKVKDVSVGATWTPTLVDNLKGTVRGADVKNAHPLPHTVAIEVKYTASPAEGGKTWTATCAVLVKPKSAALRPQIKIAKAATPTSVSIGGTVKYTFTITNPGNCELTNVALTDTKCSPVGYLGGDANNDYYLDPGETWNYECSQTMNQEGDIVNTATVTGTDPDGKLVTDASSVTVKVTPEMVVVPDIYDLTEEAARYDINEAKLTVGTVSSEASDLAPGHVTRQSPTAGTKVAVKTQVNFSISQAEAKYIYVDPPRITIQQGDTVLFTATLMFDDGTEQDITQTATWSPGPRNMFIGRDAGTFTVTVEHSGAKAFATVNVDEAEERGWDDPISHADDTLADVPLPSPSDYTWYALCKKGTGEVVYGEDTDPTRFFIMGGPFPGPRTVKKWIDDNCPRWRCTLEGVCADQPAGGGEWNVFCDPSSGAVTIGKGQPSGGRQVMQGGFLGEPDARYWVDQNCSAWRCNADGSCAEEPARGGDWNIFCDPETGGVTIGKGPAPFGKSIMEGGFLGEPDARNWLDANCPRWQCTSDGNCATGPAGGGNWYVLCSIYGDIQLGHGNPGNNRDRVMSDGFLSESDARLWVNQNCPTWRCNSEIQCLLSSEGEIDWDEDSEIDDAIDDVSSSSASDNDCPATQAEFSSVASDLDGLAGRFEETASFFDQQLRLFDPFDPLAQQAACANPDIAYALSSARSAVDEYDVYYGSLAGLYGDVLASCFEETDLSLADEEFYRLGDLGAEMQARYTEMLADFGVYKCDEQSALTEAGDEADDERDPEDVGAGVEVCDDGIDNDNDGEIDECDAGCCDKNVQVIVSDCGTAADDIFLIAVDGQDLGVTPKGQANTFNVELRPGPHSATVTCLDDGGDPLGADIGTACIWVMIYGGETIGGDALDIAYGGSRTVGFEVPIQDDVPPFPKTIDGSRLQGLENQGP